MAAGQVLDPGQLDELDDGHGVFDPVALVRCTITVARLARHPLLFPFLHGTGRHAAPGRPCGATIGLGQRDPSIETELTAAGRATDRPPWRT